ncbi:MAG: DUF7305 domain-containing protein, partial [Planctomycetota bacterium]
MNSSGFISAQSQDPPASVDLPVVIRDFSRSHSDFAVVPADGYAYYAGNVAFDLDADGKPVFTGGGFRAQKLWKNIDGKPIAPHLYNTCEFLTPIGGGGSGVASFGLAVDEKLEVEGKSVIDSFDSNLGPYGGENVGEAALVRVNGTGMKVHADNGKRWWHRKSRGRHDRDDDDESADDDSRDDDSGKARRYGHHGKPVVEVDRKSTIRGDVMVGPGLDLERAVQTSREGGITGTVSHLEAVVDMPLLAAPELGPSVEKVQYKRGQHTLSEDLHCEKLKLKKGAILNIEGDVTVFCDEKLEMKDRAEIRLMPDSTLTLYVGEKIELKRGSKMNMNTGDPKLVSIYMLGARDDDDDDESDDDDSDDDVKSKVELDRYARMAAWVQGASASLEVDNRSQFFGAFKGKKVEVDDDSQLHVDMAAGGSTTVVYEPVECELGDTAGTIAVISDGDVLSAGTFAEWWRDV